jgi:hypothetical protein
VPDGGREGIALQRRVAGPIAALVNSADESYHATCQGHGVTPCEMLTPPANF